MANQLRGNEQAQVTLSLNLRQMVIGGVDKNRLPMSSP